MTSGLFLQRLDDHSLTEEALMRALRSTRTTKDSSDGPRGQERSCLVSSASPVIRHAFQLYTRPGPLFRDDTRQPGCLATRLQMKWKGTCAYRVEASRWDMSPNHIYSSDLMLTEYESLEWS